MASEWDIAIGVMRIAEANHDLCTFDLAYQKIPKYVNLSPENCEPSPTRSGEVKWQQQVRNIKSHSPQSGNAVALGYLDHVPDVGYRVTHQGKEYLKTL